MGADIELECPQKWTNLTTNVLTCQINATRFVPEVCSGQLEDIADFRYSSSAAGASTECSVRGFRTNCVKRSFPGPCWCEELSNGLYVLKYHVGEDGEDISRYEGGSWECRVTCVDDSLIRQLTGSASPGCSNVTFRRDENGKYQVTAKRTVDDFIFF